MPTPPTDGAAPAPARQRDSLFLLARMRIGGRDPVHEVRVRNLSAGGMMAEFEPAVAPDTPVSLEMRGVGPVAGRIAWCERGRVGVAFDRPIDPKAARKPVGGGAGAVPLYVTPALVRAKAPPRR